MRRAVRSRLTVKPGAWWADKHFSGERSTWPVPGKQLGCLFLLPNFLLLSERDLLDPTFALIYEHPKGAAATQAICSGGSSIPDFRFTSVCTNPALKMEQQTLLR